MMIEMMIQRPAVFPTSPPILCLRSAVPDEAWSSDLVRPTEVAALDGYRIWIRYSDGSAGEIDLGKLAGRGVFAAWNDPDCFTDVRLRPTGAVAWGEDIELCPDALYMELTGKPLEAMGR